MSTLKASLEVGFDDKEGLLTFTQILPEVVNNEFPEWPWLDIIHALGFFEDVVKTIHDEVKNFRTVCGAPKRTVTLKFRRSQVLPPSNNYLRCGNAWLKINSDLGSQLGTLTIELHRVPGTYKDFILLDVLAHLEGRAGRGRNQYVDGRPGVLRQKLERALQHGPYILHDPAIRSKPIPADERIRTYEE